MKETNSPDQRAFYKLYLVNLLNAPIVCHDFITAVRTYPRLAAIAEKLTDKELGYLIDKIESRL